MIFNIILFGIVGFCFGKILVDAKKISELEYRVSELEKRK